MKLAAHVHEWGAWVVQLSAGTKHRKPSSREGLRCECGLVAVAPVREGLRKSWLKKMTATKAEAVAA